MRRQDIEQWYEKNRTKVVAALSYQYGCDPADAEEALQDIVLAFLERDREEKLHRSYSQKHIERLLWRAVENQLHKNHEKEVNRKQREWEYCSRNS